MLPGILVASRSASSLSPMHPAPTVRHRSVPARFPASPGMGSASRAPVHGQLTLHGLDPLIFAHRPRLDIANDSLAAVMDIFFVREIVE